MVIYLDVVTEQMSMEQDIEEDFVRYHDDDMDYIREYLEGPELWNQSVTERGSMECLDGTGQFCFDSMGSWFTRHIDLLENFVNCEAQHDDDY